MNFDQSPIAQHQLVAVLLVDKSDPALIFSFLIQLVLLVQCLKTWKLENIDYTVPAR